MKRALPPFTLTLFWSLFALAQQTCLLAPSAAAQTVTCDSTSHIDTNGNPCVSFGGAGIWSPHLSGIARLPLIRTRSREHETDMRTISARRFTQKRGQPP